MFHFFLNAHAPGNMPMLSKAWSHLEVEQPTRETDDLVFLHANHFIA